MSDWNQHARIIAGDCLETMAQMDAGSVDAVVTDPPYGLGFMGKSWDSNFSAADVPMRRSRAQDAVNAGAARQGGRQRAGRDYQRRMARDSRAYAEWCEAWAAEALRVLKPGGHLLAFGGTRTYHRLTCGIEDAGFEIRDTICWLYGSGFPKSMDVSRAIDKAAGASGEWEQRDHPGRPGKRTRGGSNIGQTNHATDVNSDGLRHVYVSTTDEARAWRGWGTALKPAHEPVVVARKPLTGTVAANVEQHGTGGLNIDACRRTADGDGDYNHKAIDYDGPTTRVAFGDFARNATSPPHSLGRWPANVALDPEAAAMLDEQTADALHRAGNLGGTIRRLGDYSPGAHRPPTKTDTMPASPDEQTTGASRFFYVAKASTRERNAGLEGFTEAKVHGPSGDDRCWDIPGSRATARPNTHPTVKPVALMRWLVRLVTPPGGMVLDPFAGSGTTGIACVLEGFGFTGIEREAEYAAMARARIAHAEACPSDFDPDPPPPRPDDRQTSLDLAA